MAAAYRFRITMEELDDFFCDIEILSNQTFEEFHKGILTAINFDQSQLASFYMSNDNWQKGEEITLMDMSDDESIKTMHNTIISDMIESPHQRILYIYDFLKMWTFQLELIKIIPNQDNNSYPRVINSEGTAPKQNANPNGSAAIMADDLLYRSLTEGDYDDTLESDPLSDEDDEFNEFGYEGEYGENYDDQY